jgi:hypothetical protein
MKHVWDGCVLKSKYNNISTQTFKSLQSLFQSILQTFYNLFDLEMKNMSSPPFPSKNQLPQL